MLELLFEPFETFALDTVGVWYAVTIVSMLSLAELFSLLGAEWDDDLFGDMSLKEKLGMTTVLAPLFEESVFRIAPMLIFGPGPAVIVASVVWALLHGFRGIIILLSVPLYVKMALAGMFLPMIFVHALHNFVFTLAEHYIFD